MSVSSGCEKDTEFQELVSSIVDLIHEPRTYEWVNKRAEERLKYQGITGGIPKDIFSPEYQIFVDNQVHFLRDVVIAVLNRF
jgi:hypothetical protein